MENELKIGEEIKEEVKDTNDYKELFGKLRQTIQTSRDGMQKNLVETKEAIEKRKEELKLLKIRKERFEGALEISDAYLKAVLPSNNKRNGKENK